MDSIYKLLIEIHKEIGIQAAHISEIKSDLREHMKRTSMNEANIEQLKKSAYMAQGGIAFLSIIATVFAILKYLT